MNNKDTKKRDADLARKEERIIHLTVPKAVKKAQNAEYQGVKPAKSHEQPHLNLFYSFDIVDSTTFKSRTQWWPVVIQMLVEVICRRVVEDTSLHSSVMWRVIGDEIVFVLGIQSEDILRSAVDSIFGILQKVVLSLKNGKFIEQLDYQGINPDELEVLKYQTSNLSLKCTSWIAVVSSKDAREYDRLMDNISFNYVSSHHNPEMHEFLGSDIDEGFRIKQYTMDRRMVVSFELAYFLEKAYKDRLFIMDYVRLKGVWNDALYPIIWYYNPDVIKSLDPGNHDDDKVYNFDRSFHYDETEKNVLVRRYFERKRSLKSKKSLCISDKKESQNNKEAFLWKGMYKPEKAFPIIVKDRNLSTKLNHMKHAMNGKVFKAESYNPQSVVLHYVVICYDPTTKKILVAKRNKGHSANPRKWDFGCARAVSNESITETIKTYYHEKFAVDIEPIVDSTRKQKEPVPIAVYEVEKEGYRKKGIIMMAKIISKGTFHPSDLYSEIRWIDIKDAEKLDPDETVEDFHNSLKYAFSFIEGQLNKNE